jgi:hypothetical protein
MKKSILFLMVCGLISGVVITSCNTSAEKVENAEENVLVANRDLDQANQEYLADISNYRQETASRVAANELIIKDFNARIAHDKKAAKAEYKKKITALEQKNHEMKMKMDNYKEDGKDKWLAFKAEFSHDMDEMGKAFKDMTVKNVK